MLKPAPKWLAWYLRKVKFVGITLPPFGVFVLPECLASPSLAKHEGKHWEQYQRMGLVNSISRTPTTACGMGTATTRWRLRRGRRRPRNVDPITAFAMVQGAISGVRKLCAVVKEAQAAGREVADLTGQVTGFVSTVLEGTDKLQKAEQEARTNPPKDKSLQVLAFEEVARKMELKKQYEELRSMIIYELGLPGGFWEDFEKTLQRMEEEDRLAKEQAEAQRRQALWQRRRDMDNLVIAGVQVLGGMVVVGYLSLLMWAIRLHRENQLSLPWDS